MQPGPPKKPTALRVLNGNAAHRPLNAREPKVTAAAPDAPIWLYPEARAEWDRVCEQLVAVGVMTKIDRAILAAYCQAYGQAEIAATAIKRMGESDQLSRGLWIKSAKGNPMANPMVGILNVALRDMLRFGAELGMTPAARSRIHATDAVAESDNPFLVMRPA